MGDSHGDAGHELSEASSFSGDSNESTFSSTTSDLTDDATSSHSSNTLQLDSDGPLYELSSLMADLPVRKGLSNYFQGKSQSFTCLFDARCIEDLAKKETPYGKRMKTCRSYAGGLDANSKQSFTPGLCSKAISKKPSRGSCASLVSRRSSSSLLYSSRPPPVPLHKTQ
ncbi:protein OXIDATIVE STRESS 3-like [Typha angustifolia]|uniref:protein OXIDATIVE STRESS 3-like n=1 Tax=Typha angustifolia TaxID=59011 RepID=UPI003C2BB43D